LGCANFGITPEISNENHFVDAASHDDIVPFWMIDCLWLVEYAPCPSSDKIIPRYFEENANMFFTKKSRVKMLANY
jgi:hypothetical protein